MAGDAPRGELPGDACGRGCGAPSRVPTTVTPTFLRPRCSGLRAAVGVVLAAGSAGAMAGMGWRVAHMAAVEDPVLEVEGSDELGVSVSPASRTAAAAVSESGRA